MSTAWDPALYLDFDDHRARPFHDLLARVGGRGAAPGRRPRLRARATSPACWPPAGRRRRSRRSTRRRRWWPPRVSGGSTPSGPTCGDWTPAAGRRRRGHQRGAAVGAAAPRPAARAGSRRCRRGAWFALQVPGNFGAPSHALVRELAPAGPRHAARRGAVPEPDAYAELLAGRGADVDVWETTYLHRLTGPDPVLDWIGATALRPVRDALDDRRVRGLPRRAGPAAARGLPRPAGRHHLVPVPPDLRGGPRPVTPISEREAGGGRRVRGRASDSACGRDRRVRRDYSVSSCLPEIVASPLARDPVPD